jgi:hypothetical protein
MLGVLVLFLLGLIFAIVLTGVSHSLGGLEPDPSSLKAFMTVPTLLGEALSAIMIIVYYVILLSPSAIAYRGLAGMDTHPEVFA